MTNEIVIQATDVEDARFVLKACLTFLQAQDLADAQMALRAVRPTPLAQETERVLQRLDNLFAQFLIERHESALYDDDQEAEEDAQEAPEGSEELAEGDLEPLSDSPLGKFDKPQQRGRRVSAKELADREIED